MSRIGILPPPFVGSELEWISEMYQRAKQWRDNGPNIALLYLDKIMEIIGVHEGTEYDTEFYLNEAIKICENHLKTIVNKVEHYKSVKEKIFERKHTGA